MRVMLNALQFKRHSSGIGQMLFFLYNSLVSSPSSAGVSFEAILSKDAPPLFEHPFHNAREIRNHIDKRRVLRRKAYELFVLGVKSGKADVFVTRDSDMPFFMRAHTKKILVVTDVAVFRVGETYQTSRRLYWHFAYRHALKKADLILAISEFTKNELIRALGVSPEKIRVLYIDGGGHVNNIDNSKIIDILLKYGLNKRYILFVGTFSPRKNLLRLIRAFEMLKNRYSLPHQLVIAGEKGWKFEPGDAVDGVSSAGGDVIFPGYIDDGDMSGIYCGAELFVFPSLYEGFGMPVVEAQRCGVPVCLSDIPSLREVAGEGGLFFDPTSPEDMCEKIHAALTDEDLRKRLTESAHVNTKRFSWENTGKQLAEFIAGK